VQITFRRSGGMGAMPGLTVDGSVDLDGTPPRVTAPSVGYERALDAAEANRLRRAATALHAAAARAALAASGRDLRDAEAYEITIEQPDGTSATVTFNAAGGAASSRGLDATTAALVDWLHTETDRIRQHRQAR